MFTLRTVDDGCGGGGGGGTCCWKLLTEGGVRVRIFTNLSYCWCIVRYYDECIFGSKTDLSMYCVFNLYLFVLVFVSTCPGTADGNDLVAKSGTMQLFSSCEVNVFVHNPRQINVINPTKTKHPWLASGACSWANKSTLPGRNTTTIQGGKGWGRHKALECFFLSEWRTSQLLTWEVSVNVGGGREEAGPWHCVLLRLTPAWLSDGSARSRGDWVTAKVREWEKKWER